MERAEEGSSPADVRINVNSPPFYRGGWLDTDRHVSMDGKNRFGVMIAGQVSTQNLNDLWAAFKAVPEDLQLIPTDTMKIEADIFERELFISLV